MVLEDELKEDFKKYFNYLEKFKLYDQQYHKEYREEYKEKLITYIKK